MICRRRPSASPLRVASPEFLKALEIGSEVFLIAPPASDALRIDGATHLSGACREDLSVALVEFKALRLEIEPAEIEERANAGFEIGDKLLMLHDMDAIAEDAAPMTRQEFESRLHMGDVAKVVRPFMRCEEFRTKYRQGDISRITQCQNKAGLRIEIGDQAAAFEIEKIFINDASGALRRFAVNASVVLTNVGDAGTVGATTCLCLAVNPVGDLQYITAFADANRPAVA